jgi:carboxyl-terminal processing protease
MRIFLKVLAFNSCLGLLFFMSCKNDEVSPGNNRQVNRWIHQQMLDNYLWTDKLPENPSYTEDPGVFYHSLLYKDDHFSFYYEDYQTLINALNGVSLDGGFEFRLFYDKEIEGNVLGIILYVKPDSPGAKSGLKRGDLFSKINGVTIQESNYRALLDQMQQPYELTYKRYDFVAKTFSSDQTKNIVPVEFAENPFLLDTVYQIEGKKIGYLVYNFFSPGPTENSTIYSDQMDKVFSDFKSEGISDLIVDFRYNSGGSEISVKNLASYILPSRYVNSYLLKKQYNSYIQNYIINSAELGASYLNVKFESKSNSVGDLLQSNRVYFITSSRTASASEATMNALKPFLNLEIIGDTTVGKDVGSRTIYDEKNTSNRIGLQPIIVKIVNNANQDYPNGFYPKIAMVESGRILYPLGTLEEPLLQAVINDISGLSARRNILQVWDTSLIESIEDRGLIVE